MSRTLGVCWIFLWITASANVTANYVLSNETVSWDNAKSRGNFATPTIHGNAYNIWFFINLSSDLNENETAWVGYYKKETAFAYIGCSLLNKTVPNGVLPRWENSPGSCFSLCKEAYRSYIGLNQGNCFCLSEVPSGNITLSECDISPTGDWIAGGNDCMSLYQKIRADIHVRGDYGGKCLAFTVTNKKPFWRRCEEYDRKLCKNGSAIVPIKYGTQTHFYWKHYVKACFERNLSPISYNDTLNLQIIIQDRGSTSTNVIRSDVIYRFNEQPNAISRDDSVKYGYITKRGNVTFLRFTNISSNKRYLLQIDSETVINPTSDQIRTSITQTSTTKTTRIPLDNGTTPRKTSSLPIKTSSITAAHTSSTSSVNDGITNSSEPLQSISETSISESSDVSVPVSISVVAVIIVAVIVTIITLKRRGKFQGICTKESAIENSCSKRNAGKIQREQNVYIESPVDNYDQISEFKDNNNLDVKPDLDVENCEYGHTYFILELGSRESHTDGNISDSGKDGAEMIDDYNTLDLNKIFGAKADDTYDTTEKAAIKLKALRETGCEKESTEKLNGNEEDTYNHISRNLLKNNKTDNIYGVTDNQENDYGDVNNCCEKNIHDGDDTYSHLNTAH